MIPFVLITTSALLFQSAFMWPAHCAWMVFIFLIPLFYRVAHYSLKRPFLEGMWWGLVFFSFHFFALFLVFYEKAQGAWRMIAPLLFTIYCSMHVAAWFWINARVARGRSASFELVLWGVGAGVYFYMVCHFMLWPCGRAVGYCFGTPLLPLAIHPTMLSASRWMGAGALTIALIFMQLFSLLFIGTKDKRYGIFVLMCALPFFIGWFMGDSQKAPQYLSTLCYVQPPLRTITDPLEQAEEININIIKSLQLRPSATCILMPESSLTHCLNEFPEILELWGVNSLANGYTLCVGSYRANTTTEYNSLFMLRGCRITRCYDKSFLMPFVEYLPKFCTKVSWIRNLFLKTTNEFSPKKDCPDSFVLTETLSVQPRLCSDVYMACQSDCAWDDANPILLAVNDAWFSARYARHLMLLYAIYYAMQRKRDILYIGHTFGCWIGHATGKTILL